jgi:hypothetical protein
MASTWTVENLHTDPPTCLGADRQLLVAKDDLALTQGDSGESGGFFFLRKLANCCFAPYGQNSRRARCPTHEPHFKLRF